MKASDLLKLNSAQKVRVVGLFSGMKTVRPINNFVRVMPTIYAASPLSFGPGTSRFSPRKLLSRPTPPFGLIYGTVDVATACYEAVIRDSFDILPSRILRKSDYNSRSAINFSTVPGGGLRFLDMTGGNAVRFGVPSDVIRYSNHKSGQFFSEFVYTEMPDIDGMLYSSRFTEALCVAVYDRAIPKLIPPTGSIGLTKTILSPTMAPWNVQVL